MKIALLGYGKQGQAAYEYWRSPENQMTVCDQNESLDLPQDITKQLGKDYLKNLDQFDLIVRSPSIHPKDIEEANSPNILDKVTTVTNEFFKVCPSKNIIGVTGTKGKGTTSTLLTQMLEALGRRVHLGGNIGTPPLDMLKAGIQPDDWVVLELANFQLIDLKFAPRIAICLMVVPEHLDWHSDVNEYIAAKQRLFIHQTLDDIAIYYAKNENSKKIAEVSKGKKITYFAEPGAIVQDDQIKIADQTICRTDELKLLGKHNWQNVCAAITAVWQISQDVAALKSVLTSFTGLPHRLEFVRDLEGVDYYDDSFGTTPETAIVAIEAFEPPKVVILGGSDKGATYDQLSDIVKRNNVRAVVIIGDTGPTIASVLRQDDYTNVVEGGSTMPEIVNAARAQAQTGDVVLLSTGCASFGLFQNYQDRGEQFKQAVQVLV